MLFYAGLKIRPPAAQRCHFYTEQYIQLLYPFGTPPERSRALAHIDELVLPPPTPPPCCSGSSDPSAPPTRHLLRALHHLVHARRVVRQRCVEQVEGAQPATSLGFWLLSSSPRRLEMRQKHR